MNLQEYKAPTVIQREFGGTVIVEHRKATPPAFNLSPMPTNERGYVESRIIRDAKTCACGADITHLYANRTECDACRKKSKLEYAKEYARSWRGRREKNGK